MVDNLLRPPKSAYLLQWGRVSMPHPLRVLTVLNYYFPYISGVSEYARLVAEGLVRHGMDVTVLTGRHLANLASAEQLNGVRLVRANPLLFLHKGYLSSDFLFRYRSLSRDADIVLMHLPMLESGVFAMMTPSTKPILVKYHCDVAPSNKQSIVDRFAVAAVRRSARICASRARKIVVSSLDYAQGSTVLRGFEHKLIEVHPPDKAPVGEAIEKEPCSNRPARVGFLGRFVEEKGIDVLLSAIPAVLQRLPDTRFLLAGDYAGVAGGSSFEGIKHKLESLKANVDVLGKIPEADLFPFYRSLDLFLLPSINSYEAFGMVQVEAMKSGVPVIATDLRGVRVPVKKTGNGLIVPPRNPEALAAAMIEMLTKKERLAPQEIADRAWKVFRTDRVIDTFAKSIRELYENASSPRS